MSPGGEWVFGEPSTAHLQISTQRQLTTAFARYREKERVSHLYPPSKPVIFVALPREPDVSKRRSPFRWSSRKLSHDYNSPDIKAR